VLASYRLGKGAVVWGWTQGRRHVPDIAAGRFVRAVNGSASA